MASGSVVEHRAVVFLPGLLLGLQLRQSSQRRLDPLGPLPRRPLPGPLLAAIRGRRVVFHLRPQRRDLHLGLCQRLLQRRPAAERRGPGRGADPHPVLCDPVQIDQALGHQRGDALGQEVVEQFAMVSAEVGEGMVVRGHVADEPLEGGVVPAEPVELPGAADPLDSGVEPQRHEDLGVDGGTPGPPLDGLDAVVQGAEVEALDVVPDDAGGMLAGDQGVERRGAEDDLLTVGRPEPRPARTRVGGLGPGGRVAGHLEEHGVGLRAFAARWGVHRTIITVSFTPDDRIQPEPRLFHKLSVMTGLPAAIGRQEPGQELAKEVAELTLPLGREPSPDGRGGRRRGGVDRQGRGGASRRAVAGMGALRVARSDAVGTTRPARAARRCRS